MAAKTDPYTAGQAAVEGGSVAQLKDVASLKRKFEQLQTARQRMEQQWKLNLAYYKGRQYTYLHKSSGQLRERPSDEGELPRYRVRLVSNQIITGAHSLLSKLTKTRPVMTATPGSAADQDLKAAQMAESLLEYWWSDLRLDEALDEAMLWAIVAGQGYWKITWDPHASKQMRFMMDPNGKPIVDESLKTAYTQALAKYGQQPQEQTVSLGDIRVEAMSPFNVFYDPSARQARDAKYVICRHYLDPEEIKTRWNKTVNPDSVPADEAVTIGNNNADKTVKQIFIGYFLPTASLPKGRYVVWMENPDEILQDDPWPYPTTDLPIVKFPGVRVPGAVYDSSTVEHAIPLQKELNRTLSQIVEYKNLTIKPRVWAPVGSLRTRLTNEPGAVYEYTPVGGQRPEIEALPSMPPYVFEHLNTISSRLQDVFSLNEVSEGKVPPNVEAGVAIDLLQEMSTDRVAPTIRLMEHSIGQAGQLMLSLAQQYYVEPRLLKIRGSGGGVQVKKFTAADIGGSISVAVEAGSGLPRTRAGRQARIESYIQMGVIQPDQAYKYLDIADLKGVAAKFQADEDQATREHDKMISGEPINAAAGQNAIQQIQQGINPETGQPLGPNDNPQELVINASLSPLPYENHDVHNATHTLFMKSVEFEQLPEDAQQRFIVHQGQTRDAIWQLQLMQPGQPPKVNLGLKGTIGPSGAAQILEHSGIQGITPQVMAEPPLETWVTDSLDKPDMDSTGNDPLTQQDMALANAAQTKQAAQAGVSHMQDVQHQQDQHDMQMAQAEQKMQHAEELHQAKLQQMRRNKQNG